MGDIADDIYDRLFDEEEEVEEIKYHDKDCYCEICQKHLDLPETKIE
jgi:hypothetical protein